MSAASSIQPSRFGFIKIEFTDDELLPLRKEIQNVESDFNSSEKWNHELAGNLQHEYTIPQCRDHLDRLFQPQIQYFRDCFYDIPPVTLGDPWVNFQQKYEFNPMHAHDGILSFVIWSKIPYNLDDELSHPRSMTSTRPVAGCFAFQYSNIFGESEEFVIPADNKMQNIALLFPANLKHCVYPFYTSDDYRISVSGNFYSI